VVVLPFRPAYSRLDRGTADDQVCHRRNVTALRSGTGYCCVGIFETCSICYRSADVSRKLIGRFRSGGARP